MSFPDLPRHSPPPARTVQSIADALSTDGWGIFPAALPSELTLRLAERARELETYSPAGVGRHNDHTLNQFVRRDGIVWINGEHPAERDWLTWTDELKMYLNRSLMLGLTGVESHFACYTPGAFYRKHLDAFRGESNRVVSVVLYLNPDWLSGDGGELVLYDAADQEIGRFPPALGTLVVYLSEAFPHEVLPTRADRFSIAGWFRCRSDLPLENV